MNQLNTNNSNNNNSSGMKDETKIVSKSLFHNTINNSKLTEESDEKTNKTSME